MNIRTLTILKRRLRFGYLSGLKVNIERPHIGWRIQFEIVFERSQAGSTMRQMYCKNEISGGISPMRTAPPG